MSFLGSGGPNPSLQMLRVFANVTCVEDAVDQALCTIGVLVLRGHELAGPC